MRSEFHIFGAATEEPLVPTFVLTFGTENGLELDYRSCLGCLVGVGRKARFCGYAPKRNNRN